MNRLPFAVSLLLATSAVVANAAEEALLPNAGFETGTLEGWTAEGDAFTMQPTRGDNPAARNREGSKHDGNYWVGTYEQYDGKHGKPGATRGDGATGSLTSQQFTIKKPFLTFLIGGGNLEGKVGVKLLCEGQEVELATGLDSESMIKRSVDVAKFVGKKARLVVYDHATDGWGHINVDQFTAADEAVFDTSLEFAFTGDISPGAYPNAKYDQPLRPQFHFSSRKNWLNDPNGMVYDGAQYHLFLQHNPKGPEWGNMTWAHAISPDMVHWTQQDHALLPYRVDGRSGTIFSGTAVVDFNNSLGKQIGDVETLCAFFTFAAKPKFWQAMAYSTDSGKTWTYWKEGRPVVPNQGFDNGERDPKVFWHEPSKQWVMVLWVQRNPGRVRIFTSPNLTDWTFASDLMRDWAFECMDVVFLPVDGDKNNTKCVMYDASFDYEIGAFDGKEFHSESKPLKAGGGNFYAAQTFNQAPHDRAVQIGWMRGGPNSAKIYDLPFNQQMSFPCELTLRTTPDGVRLFCYPIKEIGSLVKETHLIAPGKLSPGKNFIEDLGKLDLVDMTVDFDPGDAKQVVFDFSGVKLDYDATRQTLVHTGVDDKGNPQPQATFEHLVPRDGSIRLRVLVDRLSMEVYAFQGERFRAHYTPPKQADLGSSITAKGGAAKIKSLTIRELKSAW